MQKQYLTTTFYHFFAVYSTYALSSIAKYMKKSMKSYLKQEKYLIQEYLLNNLCKMILKWNFV